MKPFRAPVHMTRVFKHGHNTGWFWSSSWRTNVHIIWPVTNKQIGAYLKRTFKLDYDETHPFGAKCIEITEPDYEANVICLAQWTGDEFDHGALAHEAFHAAEHILSARNVRLSHHTTEPFAYLVQEIVDRSLQIINGKTR